jgi:hypothetical protein
MSSCGGCPAEETRAMTMTTAMAMEETGKERRKKKERTVSLDEQRDG